MKVCVTLNLSRYDMYTLIKLTRQRIISSHELDSEMMCRGMSDYKRLLALRQVTDRRLAAG